MPTTQIRTMINRYPGNCFRCGNRVEAQAGTAERPAGQAWRVRHNDDECVTVAAAVEAPARSLVGEGYYLMNDHVYNVARSRSSQRLYARRLVLLGYRQRARWTYERGAYFNLTEEMALTVEQAARLGHLHGICMVCGRTLTDPESVQRGIGPVCYGRLINRGVAVAAPRVARSVVDDSPTMRDINRYRAAQPVVQGALALDELGQGEVR